MALADDLTKFTDEILSTALSEREGYLIPESDDLALKDGAVKLMATFLYADLAGSSKLAKVCPWGITAKIIRAYLDCCVRLIRSHGGEIRSFDGDRVMGVFIGESPNTSAAKCAREIDWMVKNVINPKAKEKFKSVRENNIDIQHCIGIDTGEARAVRAGIRKNNDLIWIGRAPSLAAKLSDIRDHPYSVYISKSCYDKLHESGKLNGMQNIWESRSFVFAGENEVIYRTKTMSQP